MIIMDMYIFCSDNCFIFKFCTYMYFIDTLVEFSSSSYTGSESLKGVPVTLLITKGTISVGEEIVVNIVATSYSPVSAEGMHMHTVM